MTLKERPGTPPKSPQIPGKFTFRACKPCVCNARYLRTLRLSRNFHLPAWELRALGLRFGGFVGMKAAHVTRIEHTTAGRQEYAFKTG
jgi:hypothetical protein